MTKENDEDVSRTRNIKNICQTLCFRKWASAFWMMLGFIIVIGMRCNVGIAAVKVVTKEIDPVLGIEFDWSPVIIGYVDASFFTGYILAQFSGGVLSTYFPANKVFGTAICVVSCLNLLIPTVVSLYHDFLYYDFIYILRFLQGLADGVTIPAFFSFWRWWVPSSDGTSVSTLAFSGIYFGISFGNFFSAVLAYNITWTAPYYFYGCAGIAWFVFWFWLSNLPATYIDNIRAISIGTTPGLEVCTTSSIQRLLYNVNIFLKVCTTSIQ